MLLLIEKFVETKDKRDAKVGEHYGRKMQKMLNNPEEKRWYTKNVYPLDEEIIELANKISQELKMNKTFDKLSQVYSNDRLKDLYDAQKIDAEENDEKF